MSGPLDERTFTSREAAEAAGCSYRALDHWTRLGRLVPLVPAVGSGSQRIFDYPQVLRARLFAVASAAHVPPRALDPDVLFEQGVQVLAPGLTIELDGRGFFVAADQRIREVTG